MPQPKIKRVFHHHDLWEEAGAGMWRRPTGSERQYLIQKCAEFMDNTDAFREAMYQAIEEWPISCEVNFTNRNNNRQAWLGHAACCIAIECPEEPTRAAWWTLSKAKRDAADAAAAEVIEEWERRYLERLKPEPENASLLDLDERVA
jgi:hypothetical protein